MNWVLLGAGAGVDGQARFIHPFSESRFDVPVMTSNGDRSSWEVVRNWITTLAALFAIPAFLIAYIQLQDEREQREELEREQLQQAIREQAEQVSAWLADTGGGTLEVVLSNRSGTPVYEAIASPVLLAGAGPRTGEDLAELNLPPEMRGRYSVIPPGTHRTRLSGSEGGMGAAPGIEVAFTDRAGVHWIRRASGALVQIGEPPAEHYGIHEPVGWTLP